MPSILGICPFGGTPLGVWRAKVGLTQPVDNESPDIMRGRFLEPIIRGIYQNETGNRVHYPGEVTYRHPTETWAIAHLDGEILEAEDAEGPGILEVKGPRREVFIRLEEYGVPANYQVQVQHYMAVRNYRWSDFIAWNADCFRSLIVRIQRDQQLIDLMLNRGREFWTRHVLTGIPPCEGAAPVIRLESLEPTVKVMKSIEWAEAARKWAEARDINEEAKNYLETCRSALVTMAAAEKCQKLRGAGVSLTVTKNGNIMIRTGKQEIMV